MMKLLKFCVILFSSFFASNLNAVEPENIMVIEVEGEANGVIEIELLPNIAPLHVERIKILARDGLYNGVEKLLKLYSKFIQQLLKMYLEVTRKLIEINVLRISSTFIQNLINIYSQITQTLFNFYSKSTQKISQKLFKVYSGCT